MEKQERLVIAGQWIVQDSSTGYRLVLVERVTANCACFSKTPMWEGRVKLEQIVFAGTEAEARGLFDRLRGSEVQCEQEQDEAIARHVERAAAILAEIR